MYKLHFDNFLINEHDDDTTTTCENVQEVGYFFALYREPTGPSAGTLAPFDGERSRIGKFEGNRAHSNRRVCC